MNITYTLSQIYNFHITHANGSNILFHLLPDVYTHKIFKYKTRAVLVFATKRKNNVDPRPRAQKKVNYVQLFFAK